MGGRLEREGINIYLWLIHIVVQEKTIQHCQVIKNKLKKKKTQPKEHYLFYFPFKKVKLRIKKRNRLSQTAK